MTIAKGRLQAALAREKGTDFEKLKQKKKHKAALRARQKKGHVHGSKPSASIVKDASGAEMMDVDEKDKSEEENLFDDEAEVSGEEEDEENNAEDGDIKLAELHEDESSSDSELDEDGAAEEDGIDLEEIEDELEDDEDIIPYQRITINNTTALLAVAKRIAIQTTKDVPFSLHQSLVASETATESKIPDVSDDTNRELQFLAQALEAARRGRDLLRKEKVPFSRPYDYFAEMLKPEEQMDKVKAKLIEDAASKKAAAEARKQRDLKKFGKQVQIAKQQERAKQKRETLDKIKSLKRKRAEGGSGNAGVTEADDMFDVAVDNELSGYDGGSGGKRPDVKKRPADPHGQSNAKRQRKDAKYGFGGKKRFSKSGDAMSSGDLSAFGAKRMKGRTSGGGAAKPQRPGKARRKAAAGRR